MKKINFTPQEIEIKASRSGGPGGQNVNKNETKIVLKWDMSKSTLPEDVKSRFREKYANKFNSDGLLVIHSSEHKTQHLNKKNAFEKLNAMINGVWKAPKKRKKTKPSKGSIESRLKEKRIRSDVKKMRKKDY